MSLHHRHITVIEPGCCHVLAGTVHIVGILAIKHAEYRHQLAHPDLHLALLALHQVGVLEIGRIAQCLLDFGGINIAHALAHNLHTLSLEVFEDTLGRDKGGAVGVDD